MSREYLQSIEEADQQIGIFFQKLRQEDLFNDTHFLFLTDHGGIGKGHGGDERSGNDSSMGNFRSGH